MTAASSPPASQPANPMATATMAAPMARAAGSGTCPEATGRDRLTGWRRSAGASMASLMKYVPDAAKQKMPKAAKACPISPPCSSEPAAAGATKTNRFLTHWRGRAKRTKACHSGTRPEPPGLTGPAGPAAPAGLASDGGETGTDLFSSPGSSKASADEFTRSPVRRHRRGGGRQPLTWSKARACRRTASVSARQVPAQAQQYVG